MTYGHLDTWLLWPIFTLTYGFYDLWLPWHMASVTYSYTDIPMASMTYGYLDTWLLWPRDTLTRYFCDLWLPWLMASVTFGYLLDLWLPVPWNIVTLTHDYRGTLLPCHIITMPHGATLTYCYLDSSLPWPVLPWYIALVPWHMYFLTRGFRELCLSWHKASVKHSFHETWLPWPVA